MPKTQDDELRTIRSTLAYPINSKRLSQLASPSSRVAIAVTDSTRQVPNHKILPLAIEQLTESGVDDHNIAAGMHRPSTEEEIRTNIGNEIARRFVTVNHDAEDEMNMRGYGRSQLGTELQVNKLLADADLKIATGTTTPCSLSGRCGGSKTLMPGASRRRSIEQNHALFIRNLEKVNRGAMGGIVENNLVRKNIDDCGRMAGLDFAVNVPLNAEKQVVPAFAGDPLDVHRESDSFGKGVMRTALPERAGMVMAGHSYVENELGLFQSVTRTFATVENLVKDRGTIMLVSSCHKGIYEGSGNEVEPFRKRLADLRKSKEMVEMTKRNEVPSFEACVLYQFSWVMQRCSLKVVTDGVTKNVLNEVGISGFSSMDEAIEESLKAHDEDAKIAVVPYSSVTYVTPIPPPGVASIR